MGKWVKGQSGNPRGRSPRNIHDYISRIVLNAERNLPADKRIEKLAAGDPKWFYEKIWSKLVGHVDTQPNVMIDARTQNQNVMVQLSKADQDLVSEVVSTRLAALTRNITMHGPETERVLLEEETRRRDDQAKDLDGIDYEDPDIQEAVIVTARGDSTPPPKPASLRGTNDEPAPSEREREDELFDAPD